MRNPKKLAEEVSLCEREISSLEGYLAAHPEDTDKWILRSEIFQHLSCILMSSHYTTEQLFFGSYVAGLSPQATRKAALSSSFLSYSHFKRMQDIAKDLDNIDEE